MNSFRLIALCALLTAFSMQVTPGLSSFGSGYNDAVYTPQLSPGRPARGSSTNSNMIGGNDGVYHGGRIPASIPKAPNSLVIALKNDDVTKLNALISTNKRLDLTQRVNFKNTPIANLLPENKVMTPQEAADAIGSSNCSEAIANNIAS